MPAGALDEAIGATVAALRQPAYRHLLGVGIILEGQERFCGMAIDRLTDVFSVTKPVVARGVREAMRHGLFTGDDDRITAPDSRCPPTIGDLLAMTQQWRSEPDMDRIEQSGQDPLPGIRAELGCGRAAGRYVNAGMHLLMRELDLRTGSARSFLEETVLAPAGVPDYRWEADPTGVPWGHAHLQLSVRGLLGLGSAWRRAYAAELDGEPTTAPMAPEGLPYAAGLWFGADVIMAAGWGGQCLMIGRRSDLVVATLGETGWDRATNRDRLPDGWRSGRELFERYPLPVLLGADPGEAAHTG